MAPRPKIRKTPTARSRRRDVPRVLFVCLVLASVFGLAIFMGSGGSKGVRTASTPLAQGDDALTTGPILFVPSVGNRCRKRLIDNATWHIRDDGEVDCSTALSQSPTPFRWSAARVDVIRKGFRK